MTALGPALEVPFDIGSTRVDPLRNRLAVAGIEIPFEPKVMQVLCLLASRPGEVITREELLSGVWAREFGGDESLTRAISLIRKTLGPKSIETISKRGYRLAAPMSSVAPDPAITVPATQPSLEPEATTSPFIRQSSLFGTVMSAVRARWRLAAVAALAVVALAALAVRGPGVAAAAAAGPIQSIAVLPFRDLSETQDQHFFADGVSEQILNLLARNPDLHVAARASSFAFKESSRRPAEIAEALGVDALLDGSVSRAGDKVRVTAQLVEAKTGRMVWSDSFEGAAVNIIDLQAEFAQALSARLAATDRMPATSMPARPQNAEAYQAYLEGDAYYARRDLDSLMKARTAYEHAIKLDPKFAPAYAKLAVVTLTLPHETDGYASPYVQQALTNGPNDPASHWAEAFYFGHIGDFPAHDAALEKAFALDPGYLPAKLQKLWSLIDRKRFLEAEQLVEQVIQVDPIGPDANALYARILSRRGRADEAVKRARWALQFNPNSTELRFWCAVATAEQGSVIDAVSELVGIIENSPRDDRTRLYLGLFLARTGFLDLALRIDENPILQQQQKHDAGAPQIPLSSVPRETMDQVSALWRAYLHILAHDVKSALPWLEDARNHKVRSNYADHRSDYKPYLVLARQFAGDEKGAAQMNAEIAAEIADEERMGDLSTLLFLPYKIYAAAARGDEEAMYEGLDVTLSRGAFQITSREAIFDAYRDTPRFQATAQRFGALRKAQHDEILKRGLVSRIEAVLKKAPPS